MDLTRVYVKWHIAEKEGKTDLAKRLKALYRRLVKSKRASDTSFDKWKPTAYNY